jgi:2,4-dienoyl-CoA reductase-like NADH-dependent reductase (Old Yellow Enzyme family)
MHPQFPYAMAEGRIGKFAVKNRIYMSAQTTSFATNGVPNERHIAYLVERARGGLGLIFTEAVDVMSGHGYPETGLRLSIDRDEAVPAFARLVDALHAEKTGAFLQLTQTGHTRYWAPSDVGVSDFAPPPRQMPVEEMHNLKVAFANAARRGVEAGFDGLEIHFGHGHLLHRFFSPVLNVRSDEYGGSLDNRLRYPLEVLEAVRVAVGEDFPLGVRVSSDDLGGLGPDEHMMAPILKRIVETGLADFLNVSQGGANTSAEQLPDMTFPEAPFIDLTRRVIAGLPPITIMTTGRFRQVETAERILSKGDISFIGMTRAHTADPKVIAKTLRGEADQVRPCVACNYCGERAVASPTGLACMVNARAGRESQWSVQASKRARDDAKPVVVVGAGPAGMEFARMAAKLGHRVELYEASDRLGGQLNAAASASTRSDFLRLIEFLGGELHREGVQVFLNEPVSIQRIMSREPALTVVATGARPVAAALPGIGDLASFRPNDLDHGDTQHLGLIDREGGWRSVAAVEAWMERSKGRLTIVTPGPGFADAASAHFIQTPLIKRLNRHDVKIITDHDAVSCNDGKLKLKSVFSAATFELEGFDLIRGVGNYRSNNDLQQALENARLNYRIIGDAFLPRDALEAIHGGHRLAMEI